MDVWTNNTYHPISADCSCFTATLLDETRYQLIIIRNHEQSGEGCHLSCLYIKATRRQATEIFGANSHHVGIPAFFDS